MSSETTCSSECSSTSTYNNDVNANLIKAREGNIAGGETTATLADSVDVKQLDPLVATGTPNKTSSSSDVSDHSERISCYICIKVNKNKDFITCPLNRRMKNKLISEFWFQIKDTR